MLIYFLKEGFLISQSLVTRSKVNDAAVSETMLLDVVLHDGIVAMRVYPYVLTIGESKFNDVGKNVIDIRITCYTMDDMVRTLVIKPLAIVDNVVSRFWRFEEREVSNHTTFYIYDITTISPHV